jgi:Cu/Ag efflux protein CusF
VQTGLLLPETLRPILRLIRMRAKKMVVVLVVVLASAAAFSIYLLSRPAQSRAMRHAFTGYVLEVNPELNRITVRNADIPGIMTSMVMDYRVKDTGALAGIKPGDAIQGTMVMDGGNWLEDIKVTGRRP